MKDLNIRSVVIDDLQDLYPIYNSEKRKYPLNKFPLTEWIYGNTVFLLAETKHSKLGFIVVRPKGEEAVIDLFCIKRGIKKREIQNKLINKAGEKLVNKSIIVRVPKQKKTKLKAYREMDFKIVEEFKGETAKDSVVILSKIFNPKLKQVKQIKKKPKSPDTLKRNLEKLEKETRYSDDFGSDMLN